MDRLELLRHLLAASLQRPAIVARYADVEGWLHPDEGYTLFLAAMHGPGEGAIVEIGSYAGRSTCFLAHGSKIAGREHVTAIDTFKGSDVHQPGAVHESAILKTAGSTFSRFKDNLWRLGLDDYVQALEMSSTDAAKRWSRPIRLLFIDGDHAYSAVKTDFELFSPRVVPGGLVFFHDYDEPAWPGVTKVCDELDANKWVRVFRVEHLVGIVKRT